MPSLVVKLISVIEFGPGDIVDEPDFMHIILILFVQQNISVMFN